MTEKSVHRQLLLKWLISFFIPGILLMIPTSEVYTPEIRKFLALTVWAILMFILNLIENAVTALILTFGYAITGILPLSDALTAWTSTTIWMVFTTLVILNIMKKTTILERVAYWLIIRTGGTYLGILVGIGTLSIISLLLIPSIMTGVTVTAIAVGVCEALHLKKGKASGGIVLTAIITFGECCNFIYSPSAVGVSSTMASQFVPVDMNYFILLRHNWVFIPLVYVLCFVISRIMKPETPIEAKEIFIEKRNSLGKMTIAEWKMLIILLCLIVFLFTSQWHGIDMVYGFIFATALMCVPGIGIGKLEDIKGVNVGTLIFITACMTIGTAGVSVGISDLITGFVAPLMSGQNGIMLVGSSFICGVLLNFLMTPMALIAVLSGPFAQLATDLGFTAYPTVYSIYFSGNNVLLPYENTIYLIAFSYGLVEMKDFIKVNAVKVLICFLWTAIVGTTYWSLIGLM